MPGSISSPSIAAEAADGILALEKNWHGPLADNGAVEGTLLAWRDLERKAPQLDGNWRWQMCLLRANYDAYVRRRLIRETSLESEANRDHGRAGAPEAAMNAAMKVLNRAVDQPESPELRARIVDLCDRLYRSIGLQTSVPKYHAIGEERGAVLDFVDYPLNNRWWLEDEFQKIRAMATDEEKRAASARTRGVGESRPGQLLRQSSATSRSRRTWSAPMSSPSSPSSISEPGMTFWWWDQGKSRARLSWQATLWPIAVVTRACRKTDATSCSRPATGRRCCGSMANG